MSLLARNTPQDAYRRVELEARIGGSDPRQLVTLCYEQLIGALGTALHAAERGDNQKKSEGLTRAMSAVTALQLGVTGEGEVTWALRHLYEATRKALLDSVLTFDARAIAVIRQDYIDILGAMGGSAAQ
ncbi:MAG: flagellar export chaperone FliS [Novosphingobium sp.]